MSRVKSLPKVICGSSSRNKNLTLKMLSETISIRLSSRRLLLVPPFLLFLLMLTACASTTTHVAPINEVDNPGRGGVVYTLPRTAMDLEIPVNKIVITPPKAEYLKYTKRIFGQEPAYNESSTKFTIGNPTVQTVGIQDPNKVYYVEIIAGPFSDSTMSLNFDNRGILTAATFQNEDKTIDFIVSTIETAGKIAGSIAMFMSVTEYGEEDAIEMSMEKNGDIGALRAYQRIKRAKELRDDILKTPDVEDVSPRLKDVDSALQEDLALFFGEKKTDTWKAQFRIDPVSAKEDIPLFTYSPGEGIHSFIREPRNKKAFIAKTPKSSAKTVKVNVDARPIITKDDSDKIFVSKERGVHYNVPAPGTVRVFDGDVQLLTADYSFGQFGPVAFLPCSTGSRTLHQEVTLDSTTGVLLSVKNVSNAFDPQSINKVGTAVSSAVEAYDPKSQAERARDIAKARYERQNYEKKTEALNTGTSTSEEE